MARTTLPTRLMTWLTRLVRRMGTRAYLGLALLFSLLIAADGLGVRVLGQVEAQLFDTLITQRVRVPVADPDIVIIDIDEASLAGMAAEHGRWPWPNQVLGELARGLEAQGARAVVFDILFSDRDTLRPASDAAFNAAIADSRATFFPMLRLDPRNDRLSQIPVGALPGARPVAAHADPDERIAIILPKVPAALDNGRLGTHQVEPDKDGVIRRYPVWVAHAGWHLPSLPRRIADEYGYPAPDKGSVLLNWRGPPFTYRFESFVEVYRDLRAPDKTRPPDEFRDKIVIIGSTAPSLFDIKGTPMARIHPGVEILATAIDNFKNGDSLRERPAWIMRLAALLLIWSMAVALYRQIRIEVFDKVFGVLQVALVGLAYLVLNVSSWYLDMSAPLSLGLSYFAVARIYHGVSRKWLADGQARDMRALPQGERVLAVLALRLEGMSARERRRLQGQLDRLVARSRHGASRIVRLVEDPGFVQNVFADVMLIYWLSEDAGLPWHEDAQDMEAFLCQQWQAAHKAGRLRFAREATQLRWRAEHAWTGAAFQTILAALVRIATPASRETTA